VRREALDVKPPQCKTLSDLVIARACLTAELPHDNDRRHDLDGGVEPEADQSDRPGSDTGGDGDDRHDHIPCDRQSRERAPSTAKLIEVVPRCDPQRVPDPACRGASE
jgi:hypothetical protein